MIEGRVALREVVQQGFEQVPGQFLEQLQKTIEGLLVAEQDRRVTQFRQQGRRSTGGATQPASAGRRCGELSSRFACLDCGAARRLAYQRHSLEEVLLALTVGGLSQRKVVAWVRRFLGGTLSPATLTQVLSEARPPVEARQQQPLAAVPFAALVVDGIHLRYRRRVDRAPWASAPLPWPFPRLHRRGSQ